MHLRAGEETFTDVVIIWTVVSQFYFDSSSLFITCCSTAVLKTAEFSREKSKGAMRNWPSGYTDQSLATLCYITLLRRERVEECCLFKSSRAT